MPESNVPQIAVVILNWNGLDLLKEYLSDVIRFSAPLGRVYVIDNDSSDGSQEWLAAQEPDIRFISNPANFGYAGGYNKGLSDIEETYAVLLNSDVAVTEGWLEPLLAKMEERPDLAAIQPKILDLKHPDQFEYAGAAGGYMDQLCYPFCRGRIFEVVEKDAGQYNDFKECFWASGAAFMVRMSNFRQIGGFNEHLFAHMEEIDLCWRFQIEGWHSGCEPKSVVYHLGGGTLDMLSPRKTFLNFRNSLIVMFLNLPTHEAFIKILSRLVLDFAAAVRFLFLSKPRHIISILQAHFSFYSRMGNLVKEKYKRKQKPFGRLHGVYPRTMAWQHFLLGKNKFSEFRIIEKKED